MIGNTVFHLREQEPVPVWNFVVLLEYGHIIERK